VAQSRRKQGKAGSGSGLKPFYIALAVIALAGAGFIAYSMTTGGGQGATTTAVPLTGMEDPQTLMATARGVVLGPTDAPVQVMVFSDFTCPACQTFSRAVEPSLKAEFVEAGQVRYVYYDFVLDPQARGTGAHRHGFIAARAARCADEQGRFWDFHDMLFARQYEWATARTSPLREFGEYAGTLGLDAAAFTSCLNSDRHAEAVTANRLLGETLRVQGTPTVYVGTRPVGEWSNYEAVKQAILREMPAGAAAREPGQ
jgi:protein-disulfide isomerase